MYIVIDETANVVVASTDDPLVAEEVANSYRDSTTTGVYGATREPASVGIYRRVVPGVTRTVRVDTVRGDG